MRCGEHARLLGRRGAQRERLERELQARERRLGLVRDEGEEAVLLLEYLRLGTQRTRDHREAQAQRDEEESALPGVLADAAPLEALKCGGDLGGEPGAPRLHADPGQQLLDALGGYARLEQRLRGGDLVRVVLALRAHGLERVGALVEEPVADLHRRHQHERERRQLKDAHRPDAAAPSDSASAAANCSRSARLCASERKHAS